MASLLAFMLRAPSTRTGPARPSSLTALALALAMAGGTVSGCANGMLEEDTGPAPRDTPMSDVRTDAPSVDTGSRDAPMLPDSPRPDCGGMMCTGLTHCVDGACVDYPPCRGDMTCPTPGDLCRSRRCIPGVDDPDGDGSPASEDCDEMNPMRNPRLPEVCNNMDDNCNGANDEDTDVAAMCSRMDMPGICMSGTCSCPAGTFDIDRAVPGCECTGTPPAAEGVSCAAPIALGDFSDTGAMMVVQANALGMGREVWYSFRAVDTPDTMCDNFYVRVQFTTNPSDAYEMTVLRGGCDPTECGGMAMTDYTFATDFPAAGTGPGECPCSAADGPGPNIAAPGVNACNDNTATFSVRVRRRAMAPDACTPFSIEISNGVYST